MKEKHQIAMALRALARSSKSIVPKVHYPASGPQAAAYDSTQQMIIFVTDRNIIKKIEDYFVPRFDTKREGSSVLVSNGRGKFKFEYSSGRGFFFTDEAQQRKPTIEQQEMGTIAFLEYYQATGSYPTQDEVSAIVGFKFGPGWFKSFNNHANAILKAINLKRSHKIELDSDPSSIGAKIFMLLKKNHQFKEAPDNWNPADIWIYEKSKKSTIMRELDRAESVNDFNACIKKFFESGDLYGVSLKKALSPTRAQIVDSSTAKPFNLSFAPTVYDVDLTYYDIKSRGHPGKFMIRTRAKSKAITKMADIKIFFEGKLENSSVFLGAIPAKMIKERGSDQVSFSVTPQDVKDLAKKVIKAGPMIIRNLRRLADYDEFKLTYIYVMLRYALKIYEGGKAYLKQLGMAGFKLNDFSSIHYKVGG